LPDERAPLERVRSPHGDLPSPSGEDALVLYTPSHEAADELVGRLRAAGAAEVSDLPTVNPYWPRNSARVFVDPDGYRLIVAPPDDDNDGARGALGAQGALTLREVPSGTERDAYLPLFELADDAFEQVAGYYQTGTLLAFDDPGGAPIGIVLMADEPDGSVELKAVAVATSRQERGIGSRLLAAALERLRDRGVQRVVVATASAGVGQLAFYQKAGFRFERIERDAFTPERGYPADAIENGIPLRDRVWLDQRLGSPPPDDDGAPIPT
jgi:ribosomal protein S18 acetylase RimI-like enzyme